MPVDAPRDRLTRAWNERREEALLRLGELPDGEVEALLNRLDEAYEILTDSDRTKQYKTYLHQGGDTGAVTGPEVFGALYTDETQEKPAMDEDKTLEDSPLLGEALGLLAQVVAASPAPGDSRGDEVKGLSMGEDLPPWLNRPTPTGDVPVSPPLPAEAHEENFLSNQEVQDRLQGFHEHLAAADLIRKERNELLRQMVPLKAELEMRTSAESDLRKGLEANERELRDCRALLEGREVDLDQARLELEDLRAFQERMAEEVALARDAKEAAELTAKGARTELETARVRVAQLDERIEGQEVVLDGERKVSESLRAELQEAKKLRNDADAVAEQARDAFRSLDQKLIERDGLISELEGSEAAARKQGEKDREAVEAMSLRVEEAEERESGLREQVQSLEISVEDARSELAEKVADLDALTEEFNSRDREIEERMRSKDLLDEELVTVRSTLEDTRRAIELAHQEGERQAQRGDSLETELKERDERLEQQARLIEDLQEELTAGRGKVDDLADSLSLAREELENRSQRVREVEEADDLREREFVSLRRSRERLEVELSVARKETQRRLDQLGHAREESRRQTEAYLALRRDLGQRQNEAERLRRELRSSEAKHLHQIQEVKRASDRSNQGTVGFREEIERLREENGSQRASLRRLRTELTELRHQRDELTLVVEDEALKDDEIDGVVDNIMSLVRN
ncbi:MAG: hypothetical protein VX498_08070 [Myxococcota bacterium]|nr:hypothetical protein [Myxococcota bacterium]